jgi:uncharacterized membrane protein YhaH (DUF805 family)
MDWNNYLFGFEGRINRAKMWLAVLIIVCWMIFLSGLAFAVGGLFGGLKSFSLGVNDIFLALDPAIYRSLTLTGLCIGIFKAIAISLFVWVYSATSIKRLHDRNKSGWWMMPFFVVPGLHSHFADRLPDSWLDLPLALIAFVLCIWGFVEIYFLKGSRKTNRFGPNPLQRPDTRPRWEQAREIEMVPHKAGPPPVWRVKPGA